MSMRRKLAEYIKDWKLKGYKDDLPDEVPDVLMKLNLAPSYKAICLAILKNDHTLKTLGFTPPKSKWYSHFKRIEIEQREKQKQCS